jgi:hypothetical protein
VYVVEVAADDTLVHLSERKKHGPPIERIVARMAEAGFITNTDYREPSMSIRKTAKAALASWVGERRAGS